MWKFLFFAIFICLSFHSPIPGVEGAPAELEVSPKPSVSKGLKGLKDQLEALQLLVIELQMKLAAVEAEAEGRSKGDKPEVTTKGLSETETPEVKTTTSVPEKTPDEPKSTAESKAATTEPPKTDDKPSDPTTTEKPVTATSADTVTKPAVTDPLTSSPATESAAEPSLKSTDPIVMTSPVPLDPASSSTSTSTETPVSPSTDPVTQSSSSPPAETSTKEPTSNDPATSPSASDPATSPSSYDLATSPSASDPAASPSSNDPPTSPSSSDPATSPSSNDPTSSPVIPSTSTAGPSISDPAVTETMPSENPVSPTTPKDEEKDDNVLQPRTRLYSGPNLTGMHEDFNFESNSPSSCQEVKNPIESLETFGTCIRMYTKPDCEGQSMAYYPTSSNDLDSSTKDSFLKSSRSVSPCFENELAGAETSKNPDGSKSYRKAKGQDDKPLIPDLVSLGGKDENDPGYQQIPNGGPIKGCKLGPNGRVETIKADIRPSDVIQNGNQIDDPVPSQEDQEAYQKMDRKEGDQLGQFMGPRLGAPGRGLPFRNCFPQTQQNKQMMRSMQGDLVDWLRKHQNETIVVSFRIYVDYGSSQSTRPSGMTCVMNGGRFRRMAYLSNLPPPGFLYPVRIRAPVPAFKLAPYFRIVVYNA